MAGILTAANFRPLYRQEEGRLDRAAWWVASIPPTLLLIAMTLVWFAIAPRAQRDLGSQQFLDPVVVATYCYLIVYGFAIIFCQIAQYNVSAKRFHDRLMPGSLAGILPLAALLLGALHWLAPRVSPAIPGWSLWLADVVFSGRAGLERDRTGLQTVAGDARVTQAGRAVAILRDLIACPSVTPADAGALDVIETLLKGAGFATHRVTPFRKLATPTSTISMRASARAVRISCLQAIPMSCRRATRRAGVSTRFPARSPTA